MNPMRFVLEGKEVLGAWLVVAIPSIDSKRASLWLWGLPVDDGCHGITLISTETVEHGMGEAQWIHRAPNLP
jgi:hypothetical protein